MRNAGIQVDGFGSLPRRPETDYRPGKQKALKSKNRKDGVPFHVRGDVSLWSHAFPWREIAPENF